MGIKVGFQDGPGILGEGNRGSCSGIRTGIRQGCEEGSRSFLPDPAKKPCSRSAKAQKAQVGDFLCLLGQLPGDAQQQVQWYVPGISDGTDSQGLLASLGSLLDELQANVKSCL